MFYEPFCGKQKSDSRKNSGSNKSFVKSQHYFLTRYSHKKESDYRCPYGKRAQKKRKQNSRIGTGKNYISQKHCGDCCNRVSFKKIRRHSSAVPTLSPTLSANTAG